MSSVLSFEKTGRLPQPSDNVAIAIRLLPAQTQISYQNQTFVLPHTIMEGHRFAIASIAPGNPLLSWGLPFGIATRPIKPGDYVCNPQILDALRLRNLDFPLPEMPNFEDRITPYLINDTTFKSGQQVALYNNPGIFQGYLRPGSRGVGLRNYIVILSASSRTTGYAKQLEARLKGVADAYANINGIVAVTHTEGGGSQTPNNRDLLLRTLSGFVVHPNVGAILIVDYGTEAITNTMIQDYLTQEGMPLAHVPHRFLTLNGSFETHLQQGEQQIRDWLETVNATPRTAQPLFHLKIALQCGGSDAFSGISGNPLAAWVAREVIRHGGTANLAETDELIGAESYVLQNVRNRDVARRFLEKVEAYKTLAAWHGTSAEGNPSGGNKFRGLYNIVLKSIGAAQKRNPDVRLDEVLDYAAPMHKPGYYFMDSPGNDLESIAGQVASGCNMIFFITGNGSITNFPFVPTIKIVTTTERYNLLESDMDVNAGAYLDGTSMDDLGKDMFELTCQVASGKCSKGEEAGHAQVSIWRNWQQTSTENLIALKSRPEPQGQPIPIQTQTLKENRFFEGLRTNNRLSADHIGLILPTSLCSGQIAKMAAERLSLKGLGSERGLSRFVGLVHTEGCGMSGEAAEHLYTRTMVGYLTHPLVHCALLLEHGCEKTHNDYLRHAIEDRGLSPSDFGWASVQLDGGIDSVLQKIETYFTNRLSTDPPVEHVSAPLSALRIGLSSSGPVSETGAQSLAELSRQLIGAGATLIVPDNATLFVKPSYREILNNRAPEACLSHGEQPKNSGYYIMETQTDHWVETLTGLGGTGVDLILACAGEHSLQGHPLVPMLQMATTSSVASRFADDIDLALTDSVEENVQNLLDLIIAVASRQYIPRASKMGNTDFQFTRGLLGVSM